MNKKKILILIMIVTFSLSFFSCKKKVVNPSGQQTESLASWTLLFYLGGTNNIETWLNYNINQLENIGSNPKFHMVVQISRNSENGKATRYYIEKDSDTAKISSKPIDVGIVDSADYKVLKDFIIWATKTYPSNQYALVISSHGGGWLGVIEDQIKHSIMSTIDLQRALREARFETGRKFDVLIFNSCLMGMTEIAYQFKDEANFIVASEVSQYAFINLDRAIEPLSSYPGITGADFSKMVVKSFIDGWKNPPQGIVQQPQIFTAYNILEINKLKNSLDDIAKSAIKSFLYYGDYIVEDIKKVPLIEKEGLYSTYVDLKYLLEILKNDVRIADYEIKKGVNDSLTILNNLILAKEISPGYVYSDPTLMNLNDASGISIWAPIIRFQSSVLNHYSKLDFALDTSWLSFLYILNPDMPRFLTKYNTNNWLTYSEQNLGISFKAPDDNLFKPVRIDDDIYILGGEFTGFTENRRYFGGEAYMFINITKNITESDSVTWGNKEFSRIIPQYVDYKEVFKNESEISGENGYIIILKGTDRVGQKVTEAHTFLIYNKTGYDITYIADTALFPEFMDVYLKIIYSFKIIH
ncbi:MAG: clostripain-related cysteine peptidase [Caldisericia bacterium]